MITQALAGSIVSFFGLYDLPKTWGAVRQILLNPLEGLAAN